MPIGCTEASVAYSSTASPLSTTYSPHFQPPQWYPPGQPGDALGQSRFPASSSSPPQSVSRQLIHTNGVVYPPHPVNLVSPQQQPSLLRQDSVIGAGIADTNLAASFPSVVQPPSAFGLNQGHIQFNIQHHQTYFPPSPPHFQHPREFFSPHQGPEQPPFQISQVSTTSYPAYDPQFRQQIPAHIKPISHPVSTSVPMPMGGGPNFPLGHQSAPVNHYLSQQPIGEFAAVPTTMDNTVSPMYTGPEAVHAQDGVSYEQHTQMTEMTDWQKPAGYVTAEAHQDGAEFDDGMSDASGTSDIMDIGCDAHDDCDVLDNSLETGEGQQESAPSSSMKEEDAASSANQKSRRSQLSPSHRKQTAETRKLKACTRCRMQKMRCEPDPADPTGDCMGCRTFSKTSKKTIHRMPCYRGKITDAILFRSGGLELTKRWKGTEMKDVGDRINPKDIRTILFTLGICKEEIRVEVVAFKPQSGDVTARFWMDGEQGVRKKKDLAHYCLANIQKTATYFEEYIKNNAVNVMRNERAGGEDQPQDIIEKTYAFAIRRFQYLRRKSATHGKEERELKVLGNLFILWFAMRHSTGSSWIQGKETLGMKPETRDETYPLYKKVSVPRMILAQFDSINHTRLLSKYGKVVLSELESLMSRYQPQYFYLVYTCLFILLREASWMSADRYRHARNNYGRSVRYSIPEFVESLHDSCNNLLQHWHYYNCKPWPKPTEAADRFSTHLADIDPEEYDMIMQALTDPAVQRQLDVWRRYKTENGYINKPASNNAGGRPYEGRQVFYDWDHPFYWVSQLFEENWQPHATYQAESIDPLVR
ncbi:hypothetical protein V8C42DRAFT_355650 [Trichoderma barbatum]